MKVLGSLRFACLVGGSCAAILAGAGALAACDDSTTLNPVPSEAGDASDSGKGDGSAPSEAGEAGEAGEASTVDAALAPENGCVTFVDRTADAASRSIQWDLSVVTAPERCIKIKAGQTVSWVNGAGVANFVDHPLTIYKPGGGAAPAVDEATGKAAFPTAALFGFACGVHPSMRGVVLVE